MLGNALLALFVNISNKFYFKLSVLASFLWRQLSMPKPFPIIRISPHHQKVEGTLAKGKSGNEELSPFAFREAFCLPRLSASAITRGV